MPKVSIICLGHAFSSDGGWRWQAAADGHTHEACTNQKYEGLFFRRPDGTWQQTEGTSQFNLPKEWSKAYKKLYRRYREALAD
jgi:hypothetical protein